MGLYMWMSGVPIKFCTGNHGLLISVFLLAGCSDSLLTYCLPNSTSRPYSIKGRWYYPQDHYELTQEGISSYYGGPDGCHGEPTALGEIFDMHAMTAAHPTLPLPCIILVENLENGRTAVLRVNDRGPYKHERILDTSVQAAKALGFYHKGLAKVRLTTLVKESLALRAKKKQVCEGMEIYVEHVLHRNIPRMTQLDKVPVTGPSIEDRIHEKLSSDVTCDKEIYRKRRKKGI